MNLAGKVIVVLILVMSLVFMTFAVAVFSTHRNYREEVMRKPGGYQDVLTKAREENQRIADERKRVEETLKEELQAKAQALGKLELELNVVNDQLVELNKQFEQKGTELVTTADSLKVDQQTLTTLRKKVDQLRAEIATVRTDTDGKFKQALVLVDKLHVALGQLALLEQRNKQLNDDVRTTKQRLGRDSGS